MHVRIDWTEEEKRNKPIRRQLLSDALSRQGIRAENTSPWAPIFRDGDRLISMYDDYLTIVDTSQSIGQIIEKVLAVIEELEGKMPDETRQDILGVCRNLESQPVFARGRLIPPQNRQTFLPVEPMLTSLPPNTSRIFAPASVAPRLRTVGDVIVGSRLDIPKAESQITLTSEAWCKRQYKDFYDVYSPEKYDAIVKFISFKKTADQKYVVKISVWCETLIENGRQEERINLLEKALRKHGINQTLPQVNMPKETGGIFSICATTQMMSQIIDKLIAAVEEVEGLIPYVIRQDILIPFRQVEPSYLDPDTPQSDTPFYSGPGTPLVSRSPIPAAAGTLSPALSVARTPDESRSNTFFYSRPGTPVDSAALGERLEMLERSRAAESSEQSSGMSIRNRYLLRLGIRTTNDKNPEDLSVLSSMRADGPS